MSRLSDLREYAHSRRNFVLAGGPMLLLPLLQDAAAESVTSPVRFSADPFQLGVASGDPSPAGVVLWTRLAPQPLEDLGGMPPVPVEVRYEISTNDSMTQIVRQGKQVATPALGFSVHIEVDGLKPNTWYWYRFHAGDAVSPVGRTRTMPAAGTLPEHLRFAMTSCQHYEQGLYTAYEHMIAENHDLILHLGDYIYEYEGKPDRVRLHHGTEIESLDQYRARFAQYKTDRLLQAAHAHCPWLVVWDDHEFDNNCAGEISEQKDADPVQFLLRRANSYQAYYESMPLRRTSLPTGPHMKLYRQINFGRLASFDMLDTRQYRTDQPNGDGLKPLSPEALNPKATMLGDRQEHWLMSRLIGSAAVWNILGQQIMMARVDRAAGDEAKFSMDQWPGYDVARKRLLNFIAERRISNPIVLTGDIHSNWVNNLMVDFDRAEDPVVATEFVCTSLSSGGNGNAEPKNLSELYSENPFVKFHNQQRGYVTCEVTPAEWKSHYRIVENVTEPGAPIVTKGSFVVESGKAGATSV
ncbi:MAG: alkaline phosphatase D family protein [Planctomyces sp.]|nr:alkaline phosphatase D family protein [Planctomyces sp.]